MSRILFQNINFNSHYALYKRAPFKCNLQFITISQCKERKAESKPNEIILQSSIKRNLYLSFLFEFESRDWQSGLTGRASGWLTQILPFSHSIVTSSIFVAFEEKKKRKKSFLNVFEITLSLGGSHFKCEKDTKRNLKCQQEIEK